MDRPSKRARSCLYAALVCDLAVMSRSESRFIFGYPRVSTVANRFAAKGDVTKRESGKVMTILEGKVLSISKVRNTVSGLSR